MGARAQPLDQTTYIWPYCLRAGVTVILTSWPSAVRKSIGLFIDVAKHVIAKFIPEHNSGISFSSDGFHLF